MTQSEFKKRQNKAISANLRSASSNIDMVFESLVNNNRVYMTSLKNAKDYIQDAIDHANGNYDYDASKVYD